MRQQSVTTSPIAGTARFNFAPTQADARLAEALAEVAQVRRTEAASLLAVAPTIEGNPLRMRDLQDVAASLLNEASILMRLLHESDIEPPHLADFAPRPRAAKRAAAAPTRRQVQAA